LYTTLPWCYKLSFDYEYAGTYLPEAALTIDPQTVAPADVYKLMVGLVVPRPIAFVSTVNVAGARNLAPFSYFTAVSSDPPAVCFAPQIRPSDGTRKDTLRNIEATREFVVNVVSEEIAEQMNLCSGEYPPEVDEFEIAGLTPVASEAVRPPRVAECKASMECRLIQIVEISAKPLGGSLVIGEVVRFHVRDELFQNFKIDPDKLRAIGRMGGPSYVRTTSRFDMARPGTMPLGRE
jgi:flavin reductase (DIM6/NTAB) family NADH-FMN oxidoreductase RutF